MKLTANVFEGYPEKRATMFFVLSTKFLLLMFAI